MQARVQARPDMQVRLRSKSAVRENPMADRDASSHHSEDVDRPHDPLSTEENNHDSQSQEEQSYLSGFRPNHNIHQLTCAFLAALTTGGTTYAFGFYGDALKKSLHLTQPQLDTISSANFCAGLFSWIPGLIVDRMGVKTGLVSGGIQGAVSLSLYWGVAREFFPVERWMLVPTLSALGVSIFLSCALITGSVFKIIVSTCGPCSKGTAVGAAKGYVGLGAGVYASLFESLRSPTQSDLDFLPMAGFFFIACVTVPSLYLMPNLETIRTTTFEDESTPNHFRALYVSLLAMACLIIGQSLQELMGYNDAKKKVNPEETGPNYLLAFFLLVVWLGPIYGLQCWPKKSTLPPSETVDVEEDEGESLLREAGDNRKESTGEISLQRVSLEDDNQEPGHVDFLRIPGPGDVLEGGLTLSTIDMNQPYDVEEDFDNNKTLFQMLRTPTAWLMLFTTTILVGGGIVETNNMGQMVEALHFPKPTTSASLAFFSVAQSGGRAMTGAISDSALTWNTRRFFIDKGIPRPFFLITASITGLIAHSLLAVAESKGDFVFGCTIAGLAFGMVWPLMVLIVGEVFGTANVAANYMFFDGFTSAAGSLLLSKFVAQEVYESHVDRREDPDNVTCLGMSCFSMTHVICAALSAACVFTSLCTLKTTRHIYNRADLDKGH